MAPPPSDRCKLCGCASKLLFGLPASKLTGHPIPDAPDDCFYYQCVNCDFCYTRGMDSADQAEIYNDDYWTTQEGDWYGRVPQSLRLVAFANELLRRHLPELDILDFGSGAGGFVEMGRQHLGLNIWGTDIIAPRIGAEWFLPDLGDKTFDVIVACEVIEHLPDPRPVFDHLRAHLKSPGVFAFQTAYWAPRLLDRSWWYLGPANGHISLYSERGFNHMFGEMGGTDRKIWGGYPGLQAWMFT